MDIEQQLSKVNVNIVTFTFDNKMVCCDWIIYHGKIKRESEFIYRLRNRENYDQKSILSGISIEYQEDCDNKRSWLSIKDFILMLEDHDIKVLDMNFELKDRRL